MDSSLKVYKNFLIRQTRSHRPRQWKPWQRQPLLKQGRLTSLNVCPVGLPNRGATAVWCVFYFMYREHWLLSVAPLAFSESISIIPAIDSLQLPISLPFTANFTLSLSLSESQLLLCYSNTSVFYFSLRCYQGDWAAGEITGVRWHPGSQAAIPEEGSTERVLHGH